MEPTRNEQGDSNQGSEQTNGEQAESDLGELRRDDGQEYLDRSKLDFDPDDGLLSGTALDGSSEIPGPHASEDGSIEEQAQSQAAEQTPS